MTAFLLADLRVHDPEGMRRYATQVAPLMAQFGGEILGASIEGAEVIEGDWRPGLLVVHRWRSRDAFHAFFASEQYAPLRDLRRRSASGGIAVF